MPTLTDERKKTLRREMEALLGQGAVLSDPEELLVYESDGLTLFRALADFVVFPHTAEHVSALVKLANREDIPFVARGAGTGLSGGCLPAEGGLVISLMRMNRVLEVDYENQLAVVEPGLVNLAPLLGGRAAGLLLRARSLQPAGVHHRRQHRRTTPAARTRSSTASPPTTCWASRWCCPTARSCGSAGRRAIRRATTCSGLFVGSEGTFGIATKIVVRILKKPQAVKTVLAVFDEVDQASAAVSGIIARGLVPAAMEMIDQLTIQAVEDAFGCGYPRDAAAALLDRGRRARGGHGRRRPTRIAEACREARRARRARGARRRPSASSCGRAASRAFGAYGRISPAYMVMDGVIPRTKLPYVLRRVNEIVAAYGLRVGNVFHAGDGNLHPNILYDPREPGEEARVVAAGGEILKVCAEVGGSISGEHGIGLEKADYMPLIFSEADLDVHAAGSSAPSIPRASAIPARSSRAARRAARPASRIARTPSKRRASPSASSARRVAASQLVDCHDPSRARLRRIVGDRHVLTGVELLALCAGGPHARGGGLSRHARRGGRAPRGRRRGRGARHAVGRRHADRRSARRRRARASSSR